MTRIAMRFMAYKAEELKKYADNQWELLMRNKLAGNSAFVTIAKDAVSSYAKTIIRSRSEIIFAVNSDGKIEMTTSEFDAEEAGREQMLALLKDNREGWFEITIGDESRVGHMFYSPQFDWYVFVTVREEVFYEDIRELTVQQVVIIIISAAAATFFLVLFTHFLIRPVRNVARGMRQIVEKKDFSL